MLRELKTFLVVARCGTFAGAGQRIGLTQSAVSAQIQRLEGMLDISLFERTGRSATLNAAGRSAIPMAEKMVAMWEEMRSSVAVPSLTGTFRLGAISSVQMDLLPNTLALFQKEHPHVSIRIGPGSSLQLLNQIDCGDVDAAIMVKLPFELPHELAWQPLLREPFSLIVPLNSPRKGWQALISENRFIRYERSSFGGRLVDKFLRQHKIETDDAIELDDIGAIVSMVAQGLGVALLPLTRSMPLESVRVIDLGAAKFFREIGLLSRLNAHQVSILPLFAKVLVQVAGNPVFKER